MPSITWPQALVLTVALGGVFFLAHSHNPELAGILALGTSAIALFQRAPQDREAAKVAAEDKGAP